MVKLPYKAMFGTMRTPLPEVVDHPFSWTKISLSFKILGQCWRWSMQFWGLACVHHKILGVACAHHEKFQNFEWVALDSQNFPTLACVHHEILKFWNFTTVRAPLQAKFRKNAFSAPSVPYKALRQNQVYTFSKCVWCVRVNFRFFAILAVG